MNIFTVISTTVDLAGGSWVEHEMVSCDLLGVQASDGCMDFSCDFDTHFVQKMQYADPPCALFGW